MRVCLVYDCLYPHTVGGAERWYGALAAEFVGAGHEVTYLTRRQWRDGETPGTPGVRVVAVSRGGDLYSEEGRRRIRPPLSFAAGVFRHLAANRRRYDAIHTCSFPFFSLFAIRLALVGRGTPLSVDWFEVWTAEYWKRYLGRVGGRLGHAVQRLCARLTPRAYVFSRVHGTRLRAEGARGPVERLTGLYGGSSRPSARPEAAEPLVVFAGRHIAEKRPELIPPAVVEARRRIPGLKGLILGDGPRREAALEAIRRSNAEDFVCAPGFVAAERVESSLRHALCMLLTSEREGYGLVVVEAAAMGTPSVVVAGPDNAAVELIVEGENGYVAPSADAESVADAIVRVHDDGEDLRERTAAWFARSADELSAAGSMRRVVADYAGTSAGRGLDGAAPAARS